MNTDTPSIQSPCIKNCCLDEQDICIGCKRSLDEILRWSSLSDAEKQLVLERCKHRKNTHQ